jgi:peptidylprolyl isomerase
MVEGVQVTVVKAGSGEAIKNGEKGSFHYTGWLEAFESAKMFDTSRGKAPFSFQLGSGQVIPGWDKGLVGMQKGEIRRLTISPEMGYGASGAGDAIPPNATLYFEVEYLGPAQ